MIHNPVHVFQAIERGYTFDMGSFHQSERQRFGKLLSDLFMTNWVKCMEPRDVGEEEKILRMVLSWAPFPAFLKTLSKYEL